MSEVRTCPRCGVELPPDAPDGHCPKCLMLLGFESDAGDDADPSSETVIAPEKTEAWNDDRMAELFPDLEVIEQIGQGGMGVVYKARQKHLDRLVALKLVRPDLGDNPAFAERFTREARAMARLSHPAIISVYDFGQREELYFFIMEFIDGANLRNVVQEGELTPKEALTIVPQVCEALQFAHDEGIVHRDIKPENILVDRKGRVKIADFGLAKLVNPDATDFTLTGTRQVMGTPHYMAPEQMERPQEVDHRADIYSLGVVIYEMLTGELPLGRFAPPSEKVRVDVRLDEVVLRALEKEPARRYQQATDVKTQVEQIAEQPDRTPGVAAVAQDVDDAVADMQLPAYGLMASGIVNMISMVVVVIMGFFIRNAPGFVESFLICSGMAIGLPAFLAGVYMLTRQSYNYARIGSFLAMIPASPGWFLGGAFGLWALIVLNRPDVRASFREFRGERVPIVDAADGVRNRINAAAGFLGTRLRDIPWDSLFSTRVLSAVAMRLKRQLGLAGILGVWTLFSMGVFIIVVLLTYYNVDCTVRMVDESASNLTPASRRYESLALVADGAKQQRGGLARTLDAVRNRLTIGIVPTDSDGRPMNRRSIDVSLRTNEFRRTNSADWRRFTHSELLDWMESIGVETDDAVRQEAVALIALADELRRDHRQGASAHRSVANLIDRDLFEVGPTSNRTWMSADPDFVPMIAACVVPGILWIAGCGWIVVRRWRQPANDAPKPIGRWRTALTGLILVSTWTGVCAVAIPAVADRLPMLYPTDFPDDFALQDISFQESTPKSNAWWVRSVHLYATGAYVFESGLGRVARLEPDRMVFHLTPPDDDSHPMDRHQGDVSVRFAGTEPVCTIKVPGQRRSESMPLSDSGPFLTVLDGLGVDTSRADVAAECHALARIVDRVNQPDGLRRDDGYGTLSVIDLVDTSLFDVGDYDKRSRIVSSTPKSNALIQPVANTSVGVVWFVGMLLIGVPAYLLCRARTESGQDDGEATVVSDVVGTERSAM